MLELVDDPDKVVSSPSPCRVPRVWTSTTSKSISLRSAGTTAAAPLVDGLLLPRREPEWWLGGGFDWRCLAAAVLSSRASYLKLLLHSHMNRILLNG